MKLDEFKLWLFANGYSPLTIKQKLRMLKLIERDIDLDAASDLEIAEYLYHMDISEEAKNNRIKAINTYLKFLGRDFRLKQVRRKGVRDLWIPTEDEKEKLLNVELNTRYQTKRARLILKILFEAALRANELCNLKITDVRTKRVYVDGKELTMHYLNVVGKGNKERQVPITAQLYHEIKEYYEYYGRDPYIFGFKTASLRNIIAKIKEKTGIKRFHAHAARHYRAVELYNEGIDLEALRDFLGHSDLSTTQIYLRGSKGFMFKEILRKDFEKKGVR